MGSDTARHIKGLSDTIWADFSCWSGFDEASLDQEKLTKYLARKEAIKAYSHTDYDDLTQLELRVAEDHEETGVIDVTKDGLFIDFWDVTGATALDTQMP